MAVSVASALNVTGTDTDARDYTTASWTPTVGKVYSVAFTFLDLGGSKTSPTISGNNITWVGGSGNEVGGLSTEPTLKVWTGYADSSATAGSITFSGCVSSGQTADGAMWGIAELTDTPLNSTTVVRQYAASGTSLDSITTNLVAFGSANNATGSWIVSYDNASTTGPAITAGTGFAITTGLNASQAMGGDGVRLAFQFRNDNDTSVTASAATQNDRMLQVAFEIRELVTASRSATVAGDGAVSASGKKTVSRSGSLVGDGQVAATGSKTVSRSGTIAGDGQVAAAGTRTTSGSGTLDGSGQVAASGLRIASGSGTVAGDGQVAASGLRITSGTATVDGSGTVAGTGLRTAVGQAALDGSGAVSATGSTAGVETGQAAIAGAGLVDASGFAVRAATGSLTGSGSLDASGVRTAVSGAVLAGSGAVAASGQGAGTKAASGAVAVGVDIAAEGAREAVGQAAVAVEVAIGAVGQAEHFGSGAIGMNLDISGASPSLTASGVPEYRIVRPRRQDRQPVKYLTESKTVLRLSVIYARPTVLYAPVAIIEPLPIRKVRVRNVETRSRVLVRSQHQVSRMQKVSHPASLKWEAEIRRLEELAIIGILEELIDASV